MLRVVPVRSCSLDVLHACAVVRRPTTPRHNDWAARLVAAAVVLVSCTWLGWHWLSLGLSEREIAAASARVWDIRRELMEHGHLPWWSPWFMSGTSYALQYAQGFPVALWLGLSTFLDLPEAGKVMALGAIVASAWTMFVCARRLLSDPWAAAFVATAYALHPQQLARAGGAEHVGLSVVFPLLPICWLTWMRATESGAIRDALLCALALTLLLWTSSKHALIFGIFLGPLALVRTYPRDRAARAAAMRGVLAVVLLGAGLSAFCIIPGLEEARHARLFAGEHVADWQGQLSFKTLLSLVDRDGVLTSPALNAAAATPVRTPARDQLYMLKMESGEKYAGSVVLSLAAAAVLVARRRRDRLLFWSLGAMFLACVAIATGPTSVWNANVATIRALFDVPAVPSWLRWLTVSAIVGIGGMLAVVAYRRRDRPRVLLSAGVGLAAFLFVPWFPLLASLPLFHDVRAPFAFYDIPATFALVLMAGFFVTDVVAATSWRMRTPAIVLTLVVLTLLDYWPARRFLTENPTNPRAVENIAAAYASLRADHDWVKTYYISTRNLHLLGPMESGKPQVYEAWTKWMSPIGTGLLNEASWSSAQANRSYLDLVGARYIVFDKGDALTMQSSLAREIVDTYRQWFPLQREDEDTVIFRNPTAFPYVSALKRACVFAGDVDASPGVAIALAAKRLPLVHLEDNRPGGLRFAYEVPADGVYLGSTDSRTLQTLPAELRQRARLVVPGEPIPIPVSDGLAVPVQVLAVEREDSDQIHLRLALPEPALIVINESYHPHWRAMVAGGHVPLLRVSAGLIGLEMESGVHDVQLAFEVPASYRIAAIVSLATLLLGCAAYRAEVRR